MAFQQDLLRDLGGGSIISTSSLDSEPESDSDSLEITMRLRFFPFGSAFVVASRVFEREWNSSSLG